MAILALTQNPSKFSEYRAQFGLYGIRGSLSHHPEMTEQDIKYWLETQKTDKQPGQSLVFREEADLYHPGSDVPLERPYRIPANDGMKVVNRSKATVYTLSADGDLQSNILHAAIPGILDIKGHRAANVFDWDDVFKPDRNTQSYHDALAGPGKVSARNLVLDQIIAQNLPFRSNRAFKYGKFNEAGLIDLNHWPIHPAAPIAFDTLPIDVFRTNPQFAHPAVGATPIGTLLDNALSDGAHFRAAGNRREWLYWAPGINAGIPLTPKEDPTAELIYLAHDFAHYAIPDLIMDTAADPRLDSVLIFHRMIGETMAMVIADMFIMDGFVAAGFAADAGKHGIHDVYRLAQIHNLPQNDAFEILLRAVIHALLLGNDAPLLQFLPKTDEAKDVVQSFMRRYTRFALADYEWTHHNLQELHRHQDDVDRWLEMIPSGIIEDLRLERASSFMARIGGRLNRARSAEECLMLVLDEILDRSIRPKMTGQSQKSREETLSLTLRRYFLGQIALYAKHPEFLQGDNAKEALVAAIANPHLGLEDARHLRDLFERDLSRLEQEHRITPLDRSVFLSVFPIVKPHYVSYANPAYQTHDQVFDLFLPSSLARTSLPA